MSYKYPQKRFLSALFLLSLFTLQTPFQLSTAYAAEAQTTGSVATQDFTLITKKAISAVVSITTTSKERPAPKSEWTLFKNFFEHSSKNLKSRDLSTYTHQASGFLISAIGHIVTHSHLVSAQDDIIVRLHDGREFSATLVGQDLNTDIAVLKITGQNFTFLELADHFKTEIGQWVAALGNPSGTHPALTVGVISSRDRGNIDLFTPDDFLQTDTTINPNNAGGPLLDLSGKVLGINTTLEPHPSDYAGIGFVIPSHMIRFVAAQLIEKGKVVRGYLGLVLQPVTPDLALSLGASKAEGALIADIQAGSPAEKAGLKRGDLILQYNGEPVESVAALQVSIAKAASGTQITLQILRNRQPMPIRATVSTLPQDIGPFTVENQSVRPNVLGIDVEPLTPVLAEKFNLVGYQGVIIRSTSPKSMASWLDLRPGTLILEINQQPITTEEDFYKAIEPLQKGDNVLMLVREHSLTHYVTYRVRQAPRI